MQLCSVSVFNDVLNKVSEILSQLFIISSQNESYCLVVLLLWFWILSWSCFEQNYPFRFSFSSVFMGKCV